MSVPRFPSLSRLTLFKFLFSPPLSAELDNRPDRPLSLSLSLSLFSDLLLTEYPIPPTPFLSLFSSPTSSPTYFQSWRPVPDLLFQLSWVPDPTARMSVLRFPSLSQLSLSRIFLGFYGFVQIGVSGSSYR